MKLFKLCILFLLFTPLTIIAQYISINGKVVDKATQKPALFVTVLLLNAADSTLASGTLSDSIGVFKIANVPTGQYLLSASSVEFEKSITGPFNFKENTSNLLIELIGGSTTLGEIKVLGQRPLFEQKFGNTIINVDSKLFKPASNALEVFKRSPGLLVDASGNISFRGTSPKILFNGKDLRLGAEAEKNYLRGIGLDQIESIELMPVPPSKYEGAFATVINVILKKDKNLGFKGSAFAEYRQHRYTYPSAGFNLNYKAPKWAYMLNFSADQWKGFQELYNTRNNITNGVNDFYDIYSYIKYKQNSLNLVAGVEYQLKPNHTLDLKLIYDKTKSPTTTISDTKAKISGQDLPLLVSDNNNTDEGFTRSGFLGYKYQKNTTEVNLEMGLANSNKDGLQQLLTQKYNNNTALGGIGFLQNTNESLAEFKTINGNYSKVIAQKWQLETGFKFNFITNQANVVFDTLSNPNVQKGEKINEQDLKLDLKRSNTFGFDENIYMYFAQLNRQWTKLSASFGLRLENTVTQGKSYQKSVKRNYWNPLPTLNFTYKFNDKSSITWNNGRKISRPGVWQLNPFIFYLDAYTNAQGDPLLFAQIRSSSELSWNYKQWMFISGYNHYKNKTSQLPIYNQTERITTWQQSNLDGQRVFFDFSHNLAISPKWTYQLYFSTAYETEYGVINGQKNNNEGFTGYFYVGSVVNLPKGYNLEVSGSYNPPTKAYFYNTEAMYAFNLGLQKSFAKNRWNIQANMNDLFWTNVLRASLTVNDNYQKINNRQATRSFTLRLSHNFGTSQYNAKQSKSGASEDANRIKK